MAKPFHHREIALCQVGAALQAVGAALQVTKCVTLVAGFLPRETIALCNVDFSGLSWGLCISHSHLIVSDNLRTRSYRFAPCQTIPDYVARFHHVALFSTSPYYFS